MSSARALPLSEYRIKKGYTTARRILEGLYCVSTLVCVCVVLCERLLLSTAVDRNCIRSASNWFSHNSIIIKNNLCPVARTMNKVTHAMPNPPVPPHPHVQLSLFVGLFLHQLLSNNVWRWRERKRKKVDLFLLFRDCHFTCAHCAVFVHRKRRNGKQWADVLTAALFKRAATLSLECQQTRSPAW